MLLVLTIWSESFVSGLKALTTSTIWNFAWRLLMMPFWPVSMIIGMRAEQRVSRPGGEVQRAGTERSDADAGLAGQTAVGRGHEGRPLLVPGQDQLDRRVAQALDHIQVLLAGNAEDAIDALVLEGGNQQV